MGAPLPLMTPEGFRYYLPAFVRIALEADDGGFSDSLLSRLCQPIGERGPSVLPELALFSPGEATAIRAFLTHLREKSSALPGDEDRRLRRGLRTWEAAVRE